MIDTKIREVNWEYKGDDYSEEDEDDEDEDDYSSELEDEVDMKTRLPVSKEAKKINLKESYKKEVMEQKAPQNVAQNLAILKEDKEKITRKRTISSKKS